MGFCLYWGVIHFKPLNFESISFASTALSKLTFWSSWNFLPSLKRSWYFVVNTKHKIIVKSNETQLLLQSKGSNNRDCDPIYESQWDLGMKQIFFGSSHPFAWVVCLGYYYHSRCFVWSLWGRLYNQLLLGAFLPSIQSLRVVCAYPRQSVSSTIARVCITATTQAGPQNNEAAWRR